MKLSHFAATIALCLTLAPTARAQTIVYDTLTSGGIFFGSGAYGFGSPTFEFVPTGIPNGDNLSGFKVAIGNAFANETAKYDFTLTLFTSGASEQLNASTWTNLGSWAGQTAGVTTPSLSGPVLVAASLPSGKQLVNGDHYYLMTTPGANDAVDLAFGYHPGVNVNVWEALTSNFPFSDGQAAYQVLAGPSTSSGTPEPGTYALFASLGLTGAAFLRRRRAR